MEFHKSKREAEERAIVPTRPGRHPVCANPPTLDTLKSRLPELSRRSPYTWCCYMLILEKTDSMPLIPLYIGTGTDKSMGTHRRFSEYDKGRLYSQYTRETCKTPIDLEDRSFTPASDDINERRYVANGYPAVQPLQPFCLVNVESAASQFNDYIKANAILGLEEAVEKSDDIVKRTFSMLAEKCRSLAVSVSQVSLRRLSSLTRTRLEED